MYVLCLCVNVQYLCHPYKEIINNGMDVKSRIYCILKGQCPVLSENHPRRSLPVSLSVILLSVLLPCQVDSYQAEEPLLQGSFLPDFLW